MTKTNGGWREARERGNASSNDQVVPPVLLQLHLQLLDQSDRSAPAS